MAGTFKVEMDLEDFRIVGPDGEVGPETPYGEEGEEGNVATLTIGSDVYICRVEDPNSQEQHVEMVMQTRIMPTVTEEAKFVDEPEAGRVIEIEGDEDGEEEEGGGEEEEEEIAG